MNEKRAKQAKETIQRRNLAIALIERLGQTTPKMTRQVRRQAQRIARKAGLDG